MFRKKRETEQQVQARQPRYNGSSKVFSYHASRSIEEAHQHRLRPDEPREKSSSSFLSNFSRVPFIVAMTITFLCIGYNSFLAPSAKVVADSELTSDQSLEAYEQSIESIISQNIINRTKMTVQTDEVTRKFVAAHPEIGSANLSIPLLGQRPTLHIKPAEQFAVLRAMSGSDYILTPQGRITDMLSRPESTALGVLVITDGSGLDFEIGDQAFSRANIASIRTVLMQLDTKGIPVSSVELPASSQSFHVRLTDQPYYVKFTFNEDARIQSGAFIAAYQRFARDNITPSEYVDARVADRIYFK